MNTVLSAYDIDYVEIYTPMAKVLAYWHVKALGFSITSCANADTGHQNLSSYVLVSGKVRLVLTSTYPASDSSGISEIASFVSQNYCGVKRIALRVTDVSSSLNNAIANGAFPIKPPFTTSDESGEISEASIKLYDNCELVFIDRKGYRGDFKPGYKALAVSENPGLLTVIDHIASEVRINESKFWSAYLGGALGLSLVQTFGKSEDNRTGMILNINQSFDKNLTLVISEPSEYTPASRVQRNINTYGPGVHHLAFATRDLVGTTRTLLEQGVEFVSFPSSYYELLRNDPEFQGLDIATLQDNNILVDKEGDTYLLQKFIKPLSDRPFFIYEIVQRVNGYQGFALRNINVLKRAEELQVMEK